ncbi:MAG: MarR family transcriptional regulator [Pseudomonadota bacterium]
MREIKVSATTHLTALFENRSVLSSKKSKSASDSRAQEIEIFFEMLAITNFTAQPFASSYAESHDITLHEWRVMRVIAVHPACSQRDITNHLGLDKMTVNRAVVRLENAGRVAKTINPNDRRETLLSLTEGGLKLHDEIASHGIERVHRLFTGINAAERDQLHRMLERLLANIRDISTD